jgi:hypothetical protein
MKKFNSVRCQMNKNHFFKKSTIGPVLGLNGIATAAFLATTFMSSASYGMMGGDESEVIGDANVHQAPSATIGDLPTEMLLKICNHLSIADLAKLKKVDKRFYNLINLSISHHTKEELFDSQGAPIVPKGLEGSNLIVLNPINPGSTEESLVLRIPRQEHLDLSQLPNLRDEGCNGRPSLNEEFHLHHVTGLKSLNGGGFKLNMESLERTISNNPNLQGLNLHQMNLSEDKLSDKSLELLGSLKNLRTLNLPHSNLWSRNLKLLGSLTNLRTLDLGRNWLSDFNANVPEILKFLESLPNLRTLKLSRVDLRGQSLAFLKLFPYLQDLKLSDTDLSDEHLELLGSLTKLQKLDLTGTNLNYKRLAFLGSLSNLQELTLPRAEFGKKTLELLGSLSNLKTLNMGLFKGLVPLESGRTPPLLNITKLTLRGCNFEGRELKILVPYFGSLKELVLDDGYSHSPYLPSWPAFGNIPKVILNIKNIPEKKSFRKEDFTKFPTLMEMTFGTSNSCWPPGLPVLLSALPEMIITKLILSIPFNKKTQENKNKILSKTYLNKNKDKVEISFNE